MRLRMGPIASRRPFRFAMKHAKCSNDAQAAFLAYFAGTGIVGEQNSLKALGERDSCGLTAIQDLKEHGVRWLILDANPRGVLDFACARQAGPGDHKAEPASGTTITEGSADLVPRPDPRQDSRSLGRRAHPTPA
jgi:hypothetical protein